MLTMLTRVLTYSLVFCGEAEKVAYKECFSSGIKVCKQGILSLCKSC